MNSTGQSQDRAYVALLGLAEHFRTTKNIKKAIQCLEALFAFNPPKKVESRTHLQLGQLLFAYTNNQDLAKTHIEQAWTLSQQIQGFDDIRFDAAYTLSQFYQQQNQSHAAKTILRKAIENSQHNIFWHSKLLFQIARIHANDKEYSLASEFLSIGADCAEENNAPYLKTQFLLNRAMILIIERKSSDVNGILNQAALCLETIQNPHLKEYSRVFQLILQVSNSLQLGHVKSVKEILKQLQRIIQTIINTNWPSDEQIFGQHPTECFLWLTKEQLFVYVYVLTVSQSMISGFLEKTQKYTEKALTQIEKLKIQDNKPILSMFQVTLLEHIALCRLIMGNRTSALKEISSAKDICLSLPDKSLLKSHSSQLHCLLGLYGMSVNCYDRAEAQLCIAIQETNNRELKLFSNLNLAIIYLRTGQEENLRNVLNHIASDYTQNFTNQALLGSYYWVQGLNSYYKGSFHEAKRFLRESLKMGNAEDLNRLTSCSLVLLSQVFLSIGNSKEAMNMVVPALQLASKIPDINVQLWGSSIQKQLYKMLGDINLEREAYIQHQQYSQTLINDQYECVKMQEHNLLNWITNDSLGTVNSAIPSTSNYNNFSTDN
ncbi:MAU2 chromatid cohesion factor homolog [Chironomus tepperi]|uniref:MAU2 chromatid cohesion factor homolog n=1 Tax=Chironomus tepperi TaxID=113505 RepID=UPI00391FC640